jgi:hypothetical protein
VWLFLDFALIGDGFHRLAYFVLVTEVAMPNRFQIFIQLIQQRHAGGNIQSENFLLLRESMLHQASQAVAMFGNQKLLTHESRERSFEPIGQKTFDGGFQNFRAVILPFQILYRGSLPYGGIDFSRRL